MSLMSDGAVSTTPHTPAAALRTPRRGALALATALAGLGAVVAVTNGVLMLSLGRRLLRAPVTAAFVRDSGVVADQALFQSTLDRAYDTVQTRGYVLVVLGVAVLALVPVLHLGYGWARLALTAAAPLVMLVGVRDMIDAVPTLFRVLDVYVVAMAGVALPLLWLESSRAFIRHREGLRGGLPVFGDVTDGTEGTYP